MESYLNTTGQALQDRSCHYSIYQVNPVKLKTLWVNRGRDNYDLQEQENPENQQKTNHTLE